MLNFSEFQEYIRMNFSEIFEKEKINVELSLNSVTKNNGTEFHALTIRTEGSNIAANIYLDDSYERYVEGEDLDYLVKQIYRSVAESLVIPYEFTTVGKDLMDFDYAKDKIIMVAVNAEKNKELLADVPYQLKEDLALIYKVKLGTNNEEMATVTIHNNLLKTWGATKEEIHELAMKNTRELLPVTIQSIDEVMRELLARDGMPKEIAEAMFTEMPADQQMYVISNKPKVNGAASIFYEDELAKLAEKLGTDLYDEYALALIDLMLPDISGMEIIKIIRKVSKIPIIIITAKDNDIDKSLGLNLGADDYVVKPFSLIELTARIKANIRRARTYQALPNSSIIKIKDIEIDPHSHMVQRKGVTIDLTPIEFQILYILASHPGQAYSKERLYELIWKEPYFGNENVLNTHINRLRLKLKSNAEDSTAYVKTLWGIGYKMEEK